MSLKTQPEERKANQKQKKYNLAFHFWNFESKNLQQKDIMHFQIPFNAEHLGSKV